MPAWKRWRAAAFAIWSMSCGTTAIHERRLMQATDEAGRVGYYKVEIDGSAKLAKESFRSGLYDADALDALFGAVGSGDGDVHDVLARRRHEAVDRLAAAYYRTLEESREPADVELAEHRLAVALRSPYLVGSDRDLAGRSVDRRKYALIFSAKASEIEQAIAAIAEEKETSDAVMTALAAQKRGDFLRVQGEAERLRQALARVEAVRAAAEALQPPPAGAGQAERQRFVERASDLMDSFLRVEAR
jgi:lysyl-tRNA synthetase class II